MQRRFARFLAILTAAGIALLVCSSAASTQYLKHPDPKIPRTADGKPNLTAPAPRLPDGKPDLSGIWNAADGRFLTNIARRAGFDAPFQPWAAALFKERQDNEGRDRPAGRCLPHTIPTAMMVPNYPWKVVQTPALTVILFENFTQWRQIFTDGRDYPTERAPTWFGYSLGKWDGDTFVVDTVGFNDKAWLDDGGHPRSEAMHVTERFRRRDFGHLDVEFTFDDPKAYTKPWTVTVPFNLLPDTDIIENVCENEKDVEHIFFGGLKPKP
ncbi:MAG TPA: hypothetical protein VI485_08355 [Vicinamibacterales bacterium]|nr:hypothetical protein [Vicinamibacterales bacterium]